MNTRTPTPSSCRLRGFSLVELIGVLAIVAIMASIIAPTTLRSIARAARDGERATLRGIGEQVRFFLRTNSDLPGVSEAVPPPAAPPAWCNELADIAGSSPFDLWKNTRGVPRVFIREAGATAQRAILLSCLRPDAALGLPPPGAMAVNAFDLIWNTADGSVPPTASWNGWDAWTTLNAGEDLIISRISLQDVRQQKKTYTIFLNNTSGGTVSGTTTTTGTGGSPGNSGNAPGNSGGGNGKGNNGNGNGNQGNAGGGTTTSTTETSWPPVSVRYAVVPVGGGAGPSGSLDGGEQLTLPGLVAGDRIDLTDGTNTVIYTYVVVDHDRSFAFDGARWRAE